MAQSTAAAHSAENGHTQDKQFWALALGSIGVVYGDIGTSPLYALKESVKAATARGAEGPEAVLGILSLMTWTLILIVTLKYVLVLLNADNKGEGGTFALMALGQSVAKRSAPLLLVLGVAGAAFFYGDAVITPAISVLSAVEGLKLAAPQLAEIAPQFDWPRLLDLAVLPITITILVGLFAVQSRGTAKVAQFFGPVMLVWFAVLAVGGLIHLIDEPRVFLALNPALGVQFLVTHGLVGLVVMGLIFLVATGAEALYADLGHFGRKPIQRHRAWRGRALWVAVAVAQLTAFAQAITGTILMARDDLEPGPLHARLRVLGDHRRGHPLQLPHEPVHARQAVPPLRPRLPVHHGPRPARTGPGLVDPSVWCAAAAHHALGRQQTLGWDQRWIAVAVWRAISSSSSVGTTRTAMGEPSAETVVSPRSLRAGSRTMPRPSRPSQTVARTIALCSPMPPVKTIASQRPPSAAR